jgi:hypothetical protein
LFTPQVAVSELRNDRSVFSMNVDTFGMANHRPPAAGGRGRVNARHLPFGLAVGEVLGRRETGRLLGSHLLGDEPVAFGAGEA